MLSRSQVALAALVSLWPTNLFAEKPLRDVIDEMIAAKWKAQKIKPAPRATDAEVMRRWSLDLIGVIPTAEEARQFIESREANKRAKLIERLLSHPRFAVKQADVWDMVLFGRNPPGFYSRNRDEFKAWLEKQFAQNTPYDQLVRALLKAEGDTITHGAPMYLVQYDRRPEDAAVAVTRTFLGFQLGCARCHDHPFEDYSQVDFYGMAAFFARLELVELGSKGRVKRLTIGEKNRGDVLFIGPASQQTPGKKGKPVPAKFMKGKPLAEPELPKSVKDPRRFPRGKLPPKPKFSRKDKLAEWITAPDNPYFARAAVNRVWGQLMGKGIVHPVDDMRPSNPASHPELLDALAKAFVAHKFDLKWLIREIVSSKTYQLASRGPVTSEMPEWYERARFRPLFAEELFESWMRAGGMTDALKAAGKKMKSRFDVRGVTWDYFRRYFGSPTDGEGNFQGGMHEHLFLNNGQVHSLITKSKGGLHHALFTSKEPVAKQVERLFLQVLSRKPTAAEAEKFTRHLGSSGDRRDLIHEAIWSLMTCSEFRFCH